MLKMIEQLLADQGIPAVLAYLNSRVPHRYTGAYRIRADRVTSIYLHDKQGEFLPEDLVSVPFEASFCPFVVRDGWFRTNNSAADRRFMAHPGQEHTVSYHGVPLLNGVGEIAGTLCHFDMIETPLPDEEFERLRRTAPLLQVTLASHLG